MFSVYSIFSGNMIRYRLPREKKVELCPELIVKYQYSRCYTWQRIAEISTNVESFN